MRTTNVWIAFALISAAACGGSGSSGPPSQSANTPPPAGGIAVENNQFTPASKTVPVSTTVTWAWNSCTDGSPYGSQVCVAHNVVFDDGATSGLQSQGTYSRAFTATGTYPYHCSVHGAAMSGSITVTP